MEDEQQFEPYLALVEQEHDARQRLIRCLDRAIAAHRRAARGGVFECWAMMLSVILFHGPFPWTEAAMWEKQVKRMEKRLEALKSEIRDQFGTFPNLADPQELEKHYRPSASGGRNPRGTEMDINTSCHTGKGRVVWSFRNENGGILDVLRMESLQAKGR